MNMQHLSALANMEIDLDSVDGSLLSNNESGPPPMTRTDSVHTLSTVNTSTTFQNPDSHVSASNRRIEAAALRGGGETARGSGDSLEYEVRWAKWPDPTWEPACNLIGASKALEEYAARKKKKKEAH